MSTETSTDSMQSVAPVVSGERYTVLISTRVPHTLERWIVETAASQGLSVSAFLRHELYLLRSRSPRE